MNFVSKQVMKNLFRLLTIGYKTLIQTLEELLQKVWEYGRVDHILKDNPDEAIKRIAALKEDSSEYVRKSVGNALRDISKKFPELIKEELGSWDVKSKEVQQVYKLASKFIKWQLSTIKFEKDTIKYFHSKV